MPANVGADQELTHNRAKFAVVPTTLRMALILFASYCSSSA